MRNSVDFTKIHIIQRHFTLYELLHMIEKKELILKNQFERRKKEWSILKKNRFIETLMMDLPTPFFYLDASEGNGMTVIDGLQRLKVIWEFCREGRVLTAEQKQSLFFLHDLSEKGFEHLSRQMQRRLEEYDFIAYIVQIGTPDEIKESLYRNTR